jgi:hypothetical protein
MSSIDQGRWKAAAGMGNHFSNRHSPNSTSMVNTAIPDSKTAGPSQSIFVAIAKASLRQARHPLELQDEPKGDHRAIDVSSAGSIIQPIGDMAPCIQLAAHHSGCLKIQ